MNHPFACPICGVYLQEPYIKCAECESPERGFCLQCFAKGREYDTHKNSHAYVLMKNNFPLFDPNWTAADELKLLENIVDNGYGNWADISQKMRRSTRQCEKHYSKHFLNNPIAQLPKITVQDSTEVCHPTPTRLYASKIVPRPTSGSLLFGEMAGYMPARGDFTAERDEYAELDMKNLDFIEEPDPMLRELQKAVTRIYCTRLRDRSKLKFIIRKYGLLSSYQNMEYWRKCDSLGKVGLEKMKRFMRLMSPKRFGSFIESLINEEKLKHRIKLLQECYTNGITKLHGVQLYLELKKKCDGHKKHKTLLDDVLVHLKNDMTRHQFLRRQLMQESNGGLPGVISANRRKAPPLKIDGLPGYEQLTPKERDLCASLRLYPTNYLLHKSTLLHEFAKLGSLRLANARTVLKIDVNKTRKIYDLLLEEGVVCK